MQMRHASCRYRYRYEKNIYILRATEPESGETAVIDYKQEQYCSIEWLNV